MQAPEHLIERIKEAARKSESKPFPGMERVWDKIEERLDTASFQQGNDIAFPGMDKVWGKIEERLDEVQQPKTRTLPFRKLSVAAAVLLLLSFGTFFFLKNNGNNIEDTQTYAQQQSKTNVQQERVNLTGSGPSLANAGTDVRPDVQVNNQEAISNRPKNNNQKIDYPARPAILFTQAPVQPDEEQGSYFTRKIKGHVSDETGESLAGAIVVARESKTVAITDADGNYEITVSGSLKTLEVSGAGMMPKMIAINSDGNVPAATLTTDPEMLADVSVYDKNNKKNYVASLTGREAEVTKKRPLTDIDRAIAGQLPGVKIKQYGGSLNVSNDLTMAGLATSGFTGRPLIVIDGAPYNGNSLASLKPAEVASLTILKDESATTVYGSKGANGVIVIKTKAGKGYAEPKNGIFQKMKNIFKREK